MIPASDTQLSFHAHAAPPALVNLISISFWDGGRNRSGPRSCCLSQHQLVFPLLLLPASYQPSLEKPKHAEVGGHT
ncbi:hypothetical protein F751_0074 [Auxenochlorella protothecoides]|uniref:Uncharacterized protein n=1 Tax=Auxenochlorella protothecoides TaxID=3075 RepID=A0A087S9Y0_AUXPR|nr:hypothetical protein F751_0074 [Auxenochlorella protothecoides]KFM22534.1 hypothetical protein F751_0074 [Auxenochlorella protothecoides]